MSDTTFGTWAGLSVNDTAQVVATGYAYSQPAGDVATIVKLTRNIAILPVLVGATWLMTRADARAAVAAGGEAAAAVAIHPLRWLSRAVPVVRRRLRRVRGPADAGRPRRAGRRHARSTTSCRSPPAILILVALAGVGPRARTCGRWLGVGPRPFLLGVAMWIVIVVLGFVLATALTNGLP